MAPGAVHSTRGKCHNHQQRRRLARNHVRRLLRGTTWYETQLYRAEAAKLAPSKWARFGDAIRRCAKAALLRVHEQMLRTHACRCTHSASPSARRLRDLNEMARERTQPSPGLPRLGLATMPPFYLRPFYEWLDFTGIGEKTDATRRVVNDRIRAEAARCDDAVLADLGRLTEAEPAFMAEDGIHLTPEAYRRLGEEVAGAFGAYRE